MAHFIIIKIAYVPLVIVAHQSFRIINVRLSTIASTLIHIYPNIKWNYNKSTKYAFHSHIYAFLYTSPETATRGKKNCHTPPTSAPASYRRCQLRCVLRHRKVRVTCDSEVRGIVWHRASKIKIFYVFWRVDFNIHREY